ncbi:EAL domain-containing protein [Halobacillus sp. KGW1]|uniref:sensor domain-containing phosphodiesterase n=1 Tax=Halobacillus sp. KGW1 TaxID=1793726 RepID=UPI00078043B5|nr:EAL domain-containing protein [Halobacillus sp. KGW1]
MDQSPLVTTSFMSSLLTKDPLNAVSYILEQCCLYFKADGAFLYRQEKEEGMFHSSFEHVNDSRFYPLPGIQWYGKPGEIHNVSSLFPGEEKAAAVMLPSEKEIIILAGHNCDIEASEIAGLLPILEACTLPLRQGPKSYSSRANREERIRRQQSELMKIMKDARLTRIDLLPAFEMICNTTIETLDTDRVSVWMFDEARENLQVEAMKERGDRTVDPPMKNLPRNAFPAYFSALENERTLAVSNTTQDDRVFELSEAFNQPNNVLAMLDIPIICGGEMVGVLCCEQFDRSRPWDFDEKAFGTSIADMAAFITEHVKRKEAEMELERIAFYDSLTNLPNRHWIEHYLDDEIQKDQPFAVLYMDIDRFSAFNEELGYRVGDQLIMGITRRLKSALHGRDKLGWFQDGFVVLLHDPGEGIQLHQRISHYLQQFHAPYSIESQDIYVTVSTGGAVFPDHGDSPATIIRHAHRAKTAAKQNGRSQFRFFDPEMDQDHLAYERFQLNLRKALDKDQFELFYQPQVQASTGKVRGMEALIRWEHPEKGLLPPALFLPLAEMTGMIVEIGEWVLQTGLAKLNELENAGYTGLVMSINISPQHFEHPSFLKTLEAALAQSRVNPSQLLLEVTEQIAFRQESRTVETLRKMERMGVQIAIDDFGTGYSSMKYLSLYPIHTLKVDRSFTKDLLLKDKSRIIVKKMIELGQSLGCEVVVEGVENAETADYLQGIHADMLQGFYIEKPLPSALLHEWMRDQE